MQLDWILFGNGHGMASPYADDAFYWLADTNFDRSRRGRYSRLYRVSSGLGAQLISYEWRAPPAGTRRRLAGQEFVIFQTHRKWLRVECSWAAVGKQTVEDTRAVCETVRSWGHGR